jgi:hypothetical protein
MKWTYAIFTKDYNFETMGGTRTWNKGRIRPVRGDIQIRDDGMMLVYSLTNYGAWHGIEAENFALVEGKAEAEKFAATLA